MDWKTFTDELTAISAASALLFDNLRALLNPVSPAISAFATKRKRFEEMLGRVEQ